MNMRTISKYLKYSSELTKTVRSVQCHYYTAVDGIDTNIVFVSNGKHLLPHYVKRSSLFRLHS